MASRRGFLTAAATGVVFCSCGLLDAARAQAPGQAQGQAAARRLPVTVGGRRVKTIDVPRTATSATWSP